MKRWEEHIGKTVYFLSYDAEMRKEIKEFYITKVLLEISKVKGATRINIIFFDQKNKENEDNCLYFDKCNDTWFYDLHRANMRGE